MTMTKLALYLALSIPLVAGEVVQLHQNNFHEITTGKSVFIKFFAPWCGHCKAMAEDWEELAEIWKDHEVGLVAEVDCTVEEQLCEELEVTGFPTLMYGDAMSLELYEGPRDLETLKAFAEENIAKPICSVRNLDSCGDEVQKVIADLQTKSREELEEAAAAVDAKLEASQAEFDEGLEEINDQYEKMVESYNEKVDEIHEKSNYKWVKQILSSFEDEEGAEDEL
jgi:protein disulfide-isomerase-like protein